jgi:fumarate reductase subunit D
MGGNGKTPRPAVLCHFHLGGYIVAIFARLVLLLFGILFSAGIGGGIGASHSLLADQKQQNGIGGAAIGAVVGVFIGRALGNMVVGKPPKD